jgi:hypothetical protein
MILGKDLLITYETEVPKAQKQKVNLKDYLMIAALYLYSRLIILYVL